MFVLPGQFNHVECLEEWKWEAVRIDKFSFHVLSFGASFGLVRELSVRDDLIYGLSVGSFRIRLQTESPIAAGNTKQAPRISARKSSRAAMRHG